MFRFVLLSVPVLAFPCLADDSPPSNGPAPGHSMHSESFNEGPRQAGYLMQGMGNTSFPVSTKNPMAQRFFDQGIVQLHGFWYYEAERSFRQAAAIDPDHPMHYWGMARANIENEERSRGFIDEAKRRIDKANDKEKRLIEAWDQRLPPKEAKKNDSKDGADNEQEDKKEGSKRDRKKERLKNYLESLDSIAVDYPKDIELKAMVVLQAWQNKGEGLPLQSFSALDSLLTEIFQANPRHPAHHFRIHLWDYRKEELALQAAAMCGPSAPGIAHMWHMPGHTYSRLKRYHDAAWQQEASARVDHAHMMRDRILPDQIHNYAHNNEWLIRTLNLTGQVQRAIELAKNMIELPRHPKFNILDKRGSASYGRERLIQTLTNYGRWQELFDITSTPYFADESEPHLIDERTGWRAISAVQLGKWDEAQSAQDELKSLAKTLKESIQVDRVAILAAEESLRSEVDSEKEQIRAPKLEVPFPFSEDPFGSEDDPSLPKPISKEWKPKDPKWSTERKDLEKRNHQNQFRLQRIGYWLKAIEAFRQSHASNYKTALLASHEARSIVPSLLRMEWLAEAGQAEKALEKLESRIRDAEGELLPNAVAAYVATKVGDKEKRAKEILEKLAPIAAQADKGLTQLDRLLPHVEKLGLKEKWSEKPPQPLDVGDRPSLDTLGPFRWEPSPAPMWFAVHPNGEPFADKTLAGKPYVAILYLGFGCLHCAEQLGKFSPKVEDFRKRGIEMIAISTESPKQLQEGLKNYAKEMHTPLLSNVERDAFRAFRAFDDFEAQPLHGTFLIDSKGLIRWQDIGYEPFMDVEFLLKESDRLLGKWR
jgi:peroxiredoxin